MATLLLVVIYISFIGLGIPIPCSARPGPPSMGSSPLLFSFGVLSR